MKGLKKKTENFEEIEWRLEATIIKRPILIYIIFKDLYCLKVNGAHTPWKHHSIKEHTLSKILCHLFLLNKLSSVNL